MHTGDVGYLDEGGSLLITDRMKDVIKSGGEWISSLQLEDIASACSGVIEVAAFGISNKRWGERPMLAVVASPQATGDTICAEVKARIQAAVEAGQISKWAIPERIELLEALPRTSVGKLDKKQLRAQYCQGGQALVAHLSRG